MQQAASGTEDVSRNIVAVSRSTERTGMAAGEILASSNSLAQQSGILRSAIQQFLGRIRSEA